jgi:phytol kinase
MPSSPWAHQLLGVAAVGGWLGLLSALAIWVRGRWPEQREWSRKVVHIGCGPVMLIAWAWGIERWIAVTAAVVITLLAALNHRMRVLPAIEDVNRHSYGTIAYGASISLLLLLFWDRQPIAAVAGVLVMAIGDGLAGLLGPLVTSPSWQVFQQRRSLVGTAVMALASLLVSGGDGLVRARPCHPLAAGHRGGGHGAGAVRRSRHRQSLCPHQRGLALAGPQPAGISLDQALSNSSQRCSQSCGVPMPATSMRSEGSSRSRNCHWRITSARSIHTSTTVF